MDFSVLTHCCVLKVHSLVSRKDSAVFRCNTSVLTITNERLELQHRPQLRATFD